MMNHRTLTLVFVVSLAVTMAAAVGVAAANQPAELTVTQESYIEGDVSTSTGDGGIHTYSAEGPRVEILLDNVAQGDVVDYGLGSGGEASFTYDNRVDRYILDAEEDATYTLFWIAEEQETIDTGNNTTTTESVENRYTARISLEGTDVEVMSSATAEELRTENQRAEEILSAFEEAGDPDAPTEDKIQQGVAWVNFLENPFGNLTQVWLSFALMLVLRPEGWLLIGLLGVVAAYIVYKFKRRLHELRMGKDQVEDIDRTRGEFTRKQMLDHLDNLTWNEFFGPQQSREMREEFGSPRQFVEEFTRVLSPHEIKKIYLQLMGQAGYGARETESGWRIVGDDEATDKEALRLTQQESPKTMGVKLDAAGDTPPEELEEDDTERVVTLDEIAEDIGWMMIDTNVVDHPDVDLWQARGIPVNPEQQGDLLERLNMEARDWDDETHVVQSLAKLFEAIDETKVTDSNGEVDDVQNALSFLQGFMQRLSDVDEVPVRHYAELLRSVASSTDKETQIKAQVDD